MNSKKDGWVVSCFSDDIPGMLLFAELRRPGSEGLGSSFCCLAPLTLLCGVRLQVALRALRDPTVGVGKYERAP